MLTDPEVVLARLQAYPTLYSHVDGRWVRRAAGDRGVTRWHPFFADDSPELHFQLHRIDAVIQYLLEEGVEGVAARAKGLCANTIDNFASRMIELFQGAKLRTKYTIRFMSEGGRRAPDIEVTTSAGAVYVEFTAMHKTWDFHSIVGYMEDAVADVEHGYRIGVECTADTIDIPEQELDDLADRVRWYVQEHPQPNEGRTIQVGVASEGRVTVTLEPSAVGQGYVISGTEAAFVARPESYFPRVMKRLHDKAEQQLTDYRPNVVVIDLTHDTGVLHLLGTDPFWTIYGDLFDVTKMPAVVDAAILMWQDTFGRNWGTTRILINPASKWGATREAKDLLDLLACSL